MKILSCLAAAAISFGVASAVEIIAHRGASHDAPEDTLAAFRLGWEQKDLLLLDEPTNDLDVDTLRALEEALVDFPGCAVVISHDRWFLDRIATHILAFEGNSETVWFEGSYRDYAEDFKKRKGADADRPHRIAYRKLVHR